MTFQIDNQEIGNYISGLIEREFKFARQICKAYLQTNGISYEFDEGAFRKRKFIEYVCWRLSH